MNEELLKQIIERLDRMENRMGHMEENMNHMEENMNRMEENMEKGFSEVNHRMDRMESRLETVAEQTAKITEYHHETISRVEGIEKITYENAEDIGYLVRDMYRIQHRKNG
ncbi:DNA anti-recombination protein RmuC [Kroppenstedtia sanguinis]|uniref:t-SNARE coiled-coil homology domain-containing protein n=1 Tax=Kroppenstedtia sanguinis TaxID=1380684 RepID=A0ABW4C6S8_9BACL